jgi:hypothetical protein
VLPVRKPRVPSRSWLAGGALLVGAACGTSPAPNPLTSQPQWEWQTACCGFAGDWRSPSTEGYAYVLQFDAGGRVRAIRDGELVIETRYRLATSGGGPTADPAVTVEYDDPLPLGPGIEPAPRHLVILLENGTLLLRNLAPCADCYGDWTFLPSLVQ